jgi:light-regulated signal transduction histidine kinase (bacteriophytochrome)
MIASYLQMIERRYKGRLDADADQFIGFAVDGAKRMQTLIRDLLMFSRVGADGLPPENVDMAVPVRTAMEDLKVAIAEKQASITVDPMPVVPGSPALLAQLFQNLISNALKFSKDAPPRIEISAKREGNEWIFSVTDNGIGIDPEYQDQIFAIFKRLHGRDRYPGTGIGLAICKRIVERHRGRIRVESEPGKGSTFSFSLPASAERN